ncbi:S1/P1 nuclease [Massilia sp. Dwa41.01b]|uniref:S1/P1 nuclease n=1 Tax=unclassified Massilia TaxID=2609279 RepID=UPI001602B68C|nr:MULTISPECIES: S1/P1 nuclease [unclassified Massilia]QNA88088.1 S1/P1 nuclease [Massilia sp. Dwa41.01b]QNA98997.1 S1/P1 nuclease [Massilia sp. Se16.2.3]
MKKLACVLALTGAFLSADALAWGNDGHRAVGAIADKLLKGSNAEKQIAALLLPGESLEAIANWPDCVKGSYCGPQSPEMVDYVNANPKHGSYHYTDVPFQLEHYHEGGVGTFEEDIVQTLKQCIAVLQGKTDPALNPHKFTKRQALILLTHMTGDIHQPLHVGAAFVSKDAKFVVPKSHAEVDEVAIFDSRGGNNLLLDDQKITELSANLIPPGEAKPVKEGVPKALTKPFHSYWDSTTVDYAFRRIRTRTPAQFAEAAIAGKPAVKPNTGELATWPYQWADDALAVSKLAFTDVVPGKLVPQTGRKGETYYTFTLEVPANYPVPSSQIAKEQLIKGGYKLAEVLQAIYK